jgi:uncharacterized membrane protein YozB (DUF420 family)
LVAELQGHQWNIHGDGALLLGALLLSILVGLVASVVALSTLIPALIRHPTLRTTPNLASTAISVAFVLLAASWVTVGIAKVAAG